MSAANLHIPLVCPRCRQMVDGTLVSHPLLANAETALAGKLDGHDVIVCANTHCRAAYPVFDGIPCVFAAAGNLALAENPPIDIGGFSARALCATLDGTTPPTPLAEVVARVGRYVWAHFNDWMPTLPSSVELPIHVAEVHDWLQRHHDSGTGICAAVGAAVGRDVWASNTPTLVLDAHLPSMLVGRRLTRERHLTLPYPIASGTWTEHSVQVPDAVEPQPSAWVCCDIANPPFGPGFAETVVATNLLDSVHEPWLALGQMAAVISPTGALVVTTPWAWREEITPTAHRPRTLTGASSDHDALGLLGAELGLEITQSGEFKWGLRSSPREMSVYTSAGYLLRRSG